MLKDIIAILVQYNDQAILHKALNSLKILGSRLTSVIVVQARVVPIKIDGLDQIQFISIACNDLGKTLNDIIYKLTSPYVLFLQDTDYLTTKASIESLQLTYPKKVLGIHDHNRNTVIDRPLLVHTSFLKKNPFLLSHHLPFQEALFSAWLSNIKPSLKLFKENLVKQARKNSSTHTIEKLKMIEKYQLKKSKIEYPTITVLIANYNMDKYVEIAVVSCLLQSEQVEQLLIMDDGSTDHSYQQLQQWADREQVKVFNKKNDGKAKALNDLLPYVMSDFILELDADDWLDPDGIYVIKKYLSTLQEEVAVMYGNLRKWKQLEKDVLFKGVNKGVVINSRANLLSYRFPLGPRIYRTSSLKKVGGFPIVAFEGGRLYEDVSVLNRLIKKFQFCYHDFTVYNVREHSESITKTSDAKWNDFLKTLQEDQG